MTVLRLATPLKDLRPARSGLLQQCRHVPLHVGREAGRKRIERQPDQLLPRKAEHRADRRIDIDKRAGFGVAYKNAVAERFEDDLELLLAPCADLLANAAH